MRILVTGGAGFIGSHLVERLLSVGHFVRVLDDLSTGKRSNLAGVLAHLQFDLMPGSVCSTGDCLDALEGIDTVVHLAAVPSVARSMRAPKVSADVNVGGTLELLHACRMKGRAVETFVFFSSSSVYGDAPDLVKHEALPARPMSPYAATKAAGEALVLGWGRAFGTRSTVLRPFNVFGPRQDPASEYAAVVPRFCQALLRGEQPVVYGDGLQVRDFCPVWSVCDAVEAVLGAGDLVDGATLNVAGGQSMSVLDLLSALAGRQDVLFRFEPARAGEVRDSRAGLDQLRALGWEPRDVRADLAATMMWYASMEAR